ncbi:uncharacterized protein V1510DRAFT_446694 [Dipodascopsis tothii]|uniref:uncharacterized protein n=1 Tax=Dipodascopsis tothii TaxID=44089 RepID=UPI0034CD84E3
MDRVAGRPAKARRAAVRRKRPPLRSMGLRRYLRKLKRALHVRTRLRSALSRLWAVAGAAPPSMQPQALAAAAGPARTPSARSAASAASAAGRLVRSGAPSPPSPIAPVSPVAVSPSSDTDANASLLSLDDGDASATLTSNDLAGLGDGCDCAKCGGLQKKLHRLYHEQKYVLDLINTPKHAADRSVVDPLTADLQRLRETGTGLARKLAAVHGAEDDAAAVLSLDTVRNDFCTQCAVPKALKLKWGWRLNVLMAGSNVKIASSNVKSAATMLNRHHDRDYSFQTDPENVSCVEGEL